MPYHKSTDQSVANEENQPQQGEKVAASRTKRYYK